MIDRDFGAARAALQTAAVNEISYTNAAATPKSFFRGCIELAEGDNTQAQKLFELVGPVFEPPDDRVKLRMYPELAENRGVMQPNGADIAPEVLHRRVRARPDVSRWGRSRDPAAPWQKRISGRL